MKPTGDLRAKPTGDLIAKPTGDMRAKPTGDMRAKPTGDLGAKLNIMRNISVSFRRTFLTLSRLFISCFVHYGLFLKDYIVFVITRKT
jgi:hypothetical protein